MVYVLTKIYHYVEFAGLQPCHIRNIFCWGRSINLANANYTMSQITIRRKSHVVDVKLDLPLEPSPLSPFAPLKRRLWLPKLIGFPLTIEDEAATEFRAKRHFWIISVVVPILLEAMLFTSFSVVGAAHGLDLTGFMESLLTHAGYNKWDQRSSFLFSFCHWTTPFALTRAVSRIADRLTAFSKRMVADLEGMVEPGEADKIFSRGLKTAALLFMLVFTSQCIQASSVLSAASKFVSDGEVVALAFVWTSNVLLIGYPPLLFGIYMLF